MAGAGSLQRSTDGPTPRTDVQVAKDAWKFVQRKVQKHRSPPSIPEEDLQKTLSQDSAMSKANTLVVASDDQPAKKAEN
ncbi:hypothetical protein N7509_010714 [Penicillium cosmopolitanum]|uniref:Uncharacterized protein n=1 Tax=Penicillium cosmopolitanum TaxID=1131564 RepID=A0A9X0B4U4_9EURO|nr:uncharacterized protein N7509_010714 [Penicillium cosmopolitanum]KAJ5388173.1 hypothetical protein N7509_010714 [Penicillium cosmopolitanum]